MKHVLEASSNSDLDDRWKREGSLIVLVWVFCQQRWPIEKMSSFDQSCQGLCLWGTGKEIEHWNEEKLLVDVWQFNSALGGFVPKQVWPKNYDQIWNTHLVRHLRDNRSKRTRKSVFMLWKTSSALRRARKSKRNSILVLFSGGSRLRIWSICFDLCKLSGSALASNHSLQTEI